MKKIFATLAVTGLSVAAFAQGYINWTGAAASLYGATNGTAYSSFEAAGTATLNGTTGVTMNNTAANNAALGIAVIITNCSRALRLSPLRQPSLV
jgi:hypothetical protein